jgi:hypothetical protein
MMRIPIDLHCHIYGDFDLTTALGAAVNSLKRHTTSSCGGLLVAEIPGKTLTFAQIAAPPEAQLDIHQDGSKSLALNDFRLILIPAQQIICAEGLEVLAVGEYGFSAGIPLVEMLQIAKRRNTPLILPRGIGKWSFGRLKSLQTLIDAYLPGDIVLGDIPARTRSRKLLDSFAQSSFAVIAGSDPLPLPQEAERLGSFGSYLELTNLSLPLQSLTETLFLARGRLPQFGSDQPLIRTLSQSFRLIARKKHLPFA